jgi:hypothetical protein
LKKGEEEVKSRWAGFKPAPASSLPRFTEAIIVIQQKVLVCVITVANARKEP